MVCNVISTMDWLYIACIYSDVLICMWMYASVLNVHMECFCVCMSIACACMSVSVSIYYIVLYGACVHVCNYIWCEWLCIYSYFMYMCIVCNGFYFPNLNSPPTLTFPISTSIHPPKFQHSNLVMWRYFCSCSVVNHKHRSKICKNGR